MDIYKQAKKFKSRFPGTVAWRLKQNSSIIEKHLNPGEEVEYVFAGQKNDRWYDIFSTAIVAITNKRIMIGRKRVIYGYAFDSVMPYMYNDLNIRVGLFWGKVEIDTVKEIMVFTNISKGAIPEIENNVSENMMRLKKTYPKEKEKDEK